MTGLSSVAGTPLQATVQTFYDNVARGTSTSSYGPMVTPGQAVITLLRSAVQSAEFCRTEVDRRRTESDFGSEATAGPTTEQNPTTQNLGQNLDVMI
jgi:hypothetical protein